MTLPGIEHFDRIVMEAPFSKPLPAGDAMNALAQAAALLQHEAAGVPDSVHAPMPSAKDKDKKPKRGRGAV